jgi:WD40 repeat protein
MNLKKQTDDNNDSLDRINPDPRGLTPFSGKIDLRSFMRHHYKPDCIRHGIRSVNLTSNSRYLIITYESSRGYIRVIDLEKLELLPHSYSGHRDSVRMVSVFKNNKYFFTASWDGTFQKI